MTNILIVFKWKKIMDKHFVGIKWFKYGLETFLAETQGSDDYIQDLGEKSRKGLFFKRRKSGD